MSTLIPFLLLLAADPVARPGVGEIAPAFTLPGSQGKPVSLSDYRGQKTVVLAFFPKAFTAG
jgi:thioredoxin-dependent peroxiredoxin